MLRGYRFLIVAVGLILCGAGPPNEQGVIEQPANQVEPTAAPLPDYAPYPGYKPDPCYQAKNHDTADLCAQWRAAIAAEKAANESSRGNWINALAALFSAASVVLVVIALRQTEKSLKAARDANDIAAGTSKRQLRAYIQPVSVCVDFGPMHNPPRVTLKFRNSGSTPAYDVQASLATVDHVADSDSFKCRFASRPFRSKMVIGPDTEQIITGRLTDPRATDSILDWNYVAFGVIVYRDAFGHRRLTTFKYTIPHNVVRRGNGRGEIAMTACAKGNRSS